MLKAGRAGEAEARLRRFDGEFRWFLFRIAFLCDEAGTVTKWFGINTDIEDRKRAEEALRSSEWSLRQMTETIPQMLWSAAPDGRITYCNHHLQDFTGFSAEAIRGGGWTNLLHPDDVEPTRKVWLRCVEAGEPYQVEVRTIHAADGTYRWLLTNALPLRDGNGKITQWYGTCVDIHDRKVAEASIAASERNLAQIIDTIPVYVWAASSDHSIDFLNKHCLEYLGISREQARDFTWSRVVHPEDYRRHVSTWDKLFASGCGSESQIRLRRFDGQYRWFLFRANPLKDADGSVRWFAVAIDIEEAKQGEDLLRASEWNLRHLTETIPQMLWSAAPDGMIDYCNTRLLDYTGFSGEEIIGDGWRSLVHPDDLEMAARAWSSSIAGGTPFQVEARVIHAAGRAHRWCLTTALPLRDERGRILKWHGACVDMHDWKKAQDELRDMQAELAHVTRVMTMGQLTASIAHELNQPLAGIMTNAGTGLRMLSTIPANVEGARETARRTIRDAKRASEVISRLRALFAKRSAVSEVVDLSAITREVIALSTPELRRNGIDLKATLAGNLPLVVGDRVQLQQVIFNFLLNGIESMAKVVDQSKEMAISTDVDEDGHVRVTVRDSGTGFDVADARKLFSPFYTTKDSGMGIGLSVSRTIIENHQGRLWAELNDGIGATFGFSIPATNSVGQPLRGPDVPLPGPADAGGHG
jgi:PAS domain S-box-containing protein